MIKISKYDNYLRSTLEPTFRIKEIKLLKRLPKGIRYFDISIIDGEIDKSFELVCKDKTEKEILIYARISSILWFIVKGLYFRKDGGEYHRIYLKKGKR